MLRLTPKIRGGLIRAYGSYWKNLPPMTSNGASGSSGLICEEFTARALLKAESRNARWQKMHADGRSWQKDILALSHCLERLHESGMPWLIARTFEPVRMK